MKINDRASQKKLSLVAVTCWAIWTDRNKTIHNESIPPIQVRSKWIKDYLEEFWRANSSNPRLNAEDLRETSFLDRYNGWIPPPDGFWKLHTDAACSSSKPETSLGILIRDNHGKMVVASSHGRTQSNS